MTSMQDELVSKYSATQQTICVFTTAGHMSLSKFNQFMSLHYYKVHFNNPPSTPFSMRFFPSGTQPKSCTYVLFNLCAMHSHDKGLLQHTVTWLGHLLALISTQTGESLLADSLMY
jgi:hypothetical protein